MSRYKGQFVQNVRNDVPSRRSDMIVWHNLSNDTPSGDIGAISGSDFPNSADTRISAPISVRPSGIVPPFYVRYFWYQNGGTTGTVTINGWVLAQGDGDSMALTPTEFSLDDVGTADEDFHVSAWSAAITVNGTFADEDLLHIGIERLGTSDAFAGALLLIGVEFSYELRDTAGWPVT